jgi:hypothetical protein
MRFALKEILEKFAGVLARWLRDKRPGKLVLTIDLSPGNIQDWHIETKGKGD